MNQQESEEFLSSKNEWVHIFEALDIPQTANYFYNQPGAERWLVICRGGNCRSVAVSFLLKYKYMKDALAASIEKNDRDTLLMLASWASKIIVTEEAHMRDLTTILQHVSPKLKLVELGHINRLRSYPFEIPFLLEVDKKLEEVIRGTTP